MTFGAMDFKLMDIFAPHNNARKNLGYLARGHDGTAEYGHHEARLLHAAPRKSASLKKSIPTRR
jgi:hypothetical protein